MGVSIIFPWTVIKQGNVFVFTSVQVIKRGNGKSNLLSLEHIRS